MRIRIHKPNTMDTDYPSLIWNIVFWRTLFTGIVQLFFPNIALSLVNALVLVLSLIIYVYGIFRKKILIFVHRAYLVILLYIVVLVSQMLISPNKYLDIYFSYVLKYVLIPVVSIIAIQSTEYFLKCYSCFATVTFIILGFQPILKGNVFANYMDYGFNLILPCGIAFYLFRKRNKKYWLLPFEISCYIFSITFANRSTALTLIFAIFIYNLFVEKSNSKRTIKIVSLFIVAIILARNARPILKFLVNFMQINLNYSNTSLNKTVDFLLGNKENFTSGRDIIWRHAIKHFLNHSILGMGVGGYDSLYGYSHNIIIDFGLSWGILGIVILFALLIYCAYVFLNVKNDDNKVFMLLLMLLWFPKLLLSSTFTYDVSFWSFVTIAVLYGRNIKSYNNIKKFEKSEVDQDTKQIPVNTNKRR